MKIVKKSLTQEGVAHLIPILFIIVITLIGLAGWYVFSQNSDKSSGSNGSSGDSNYVNWSFNGSTWQAEGEAPTCQEPLAIASPIDITAVNAVLYPGQVRGGNYKPHGGLGVDGAATNQYDVTALRDAYLYRGSRYIENGAVQYMFDFLDPCGILYRYDHLATLTPEFQAYADQLPPAKPDESRTENFSEHPFVKQGTKIATAIGYSQPTVNAFLDVGVYDLRQQNAVSKTATYTNDPMRSQYKELGYFGVCWFDLLQGQEKTIISGLPPRNSDENASDYCQIS